jgi:DNA-binding IclR family transcriptional regulator
MVISRLEAEPVDLDGLVGLFFRGRYKGIAVKALGTLRERRMTTKELAVTIGESRTSVSDVAKRMERLGIIQREWRYSPWSLSSQLGRRLNRYCLFWKHFHDAAA